MSPIAVRRRARKPKVKTGCLTCKIRHVKCDEGKPECMKCRNTGRSCDGYEDPFPPTTKTHGSTSHNDSRISTTSLPFIINGNEQERRGFQYFVECTMPAVSGYFLSDFWTTLILPASHADPAILHIVIAFGSVHEMHSSPPRPQDEATLRFALQQSNKAIRHLSRQISSPSSPPRSGEIILISCILFIFLETFQQNHAAALSHLECGLKILSSWIHPSSASQPPFPESSVARPSLNFIHDTLVPMFRLLDLQTSTYLTARPVHRDVLAKPGVGVHIPIEIPATFATLQEANDCLHDLLHWMMHYTQTAQMYLSHAPGDPVPNLPENLVAKFMQAQKDNHLLLEQYLASLNRFLKVHTECLTAEALRGVVVLKIKHLNTVILNGACVADHEMGFDQYNDDFERMVKLSESLVVQPRRGKAGGVGKVSYSFDMNVLAPLYHSVCRCRDPIIRRRALALLGSSSRREGMWDSEVMGAIGRWVLEEEERGLGTVSTSEMVGIGKRISIIDKVFLFGERRCLVRYYQGVRVSDGGCGALEKVISW